MCIPNDVALPRGFFTLLMWNFYFFKKVKYGHHFSPFLEHRENMRSQEKKIHHLESLYSDWILESGK